MACAPQLQANEGIAHLLVFPGVRVASTIGTAVILGV